MYMVTQPKYSIVYINREHATMPKTMAVLPSLNKRIQTIINK